MQASLAIIAVAVAVFAPAVAQDASAGSSSCPEACPAIYAPVCASDGQTYSSGCAFEAAKCSSGNAALEIVSTGECGQDTNSSGSVNCAAISCLAIYDPVCGSDGQTYGNECTLGVASCFDPSITQVSTGECGSGSQSGSAEVGDDASDADAGTSLNSGSGQCSTVCTREYAPVCGSDGVTYNNDCLFENAQCLDSSLSLASSGACSSGSSGSSGSSSNSAARPGGSVGGRWLAVTAVACFTAASTL